MESFEEKFNQLNEEEVLSEIESLLREKGLENVAVTMLRLTEKKGDGDDSVVTNACPEGKRPHYYYEYRNGRLVKRMRCVNA